MKVITRMEYEKDLEFCTLTIVILHGEVRLVKACRMVRGNYPIIVVSL